MKKKNILLIILLVSIILSACNKTQNSIQAGD